MPTTRKIVKVFLGSPGDLGPERQAAKAVVDAFNREWADHLGIHVELVGWEDTVTKFGRAQDVINRDLDQCDLFVGMMWKAWGSPPSKHGPYSSGFEEEFDRSIKSRKKLGKPEISLFFKEVDPELLRDQGEGLKKVLAFKQKIIDDKEILFQSFIDVRDIEGKFRSCITDYVQGLAKAEESRVSQESSAPADGEKDRGETIGDSSKSLFGSEAINFLKNLIAKSEGNRSEDPIRPVEVARLRLVGSLINAGGNDQTGLGVHDANILFAHREELTLSQLEVEGLVDSALVNLSHQNVPLWHWYAISNAAARGYLSQRALFGSQSEKIGALGAMRLVSEPLSMKPIVGDHVFEVDRNTYIESWLTGDADDRLRVAALNYLGVCGTKADLPIIKTEFDRGSYQTVGPATEAIIRLNLRDSRTSALEVLNDLQPKTINQRLVEELFDKPDAINTAQLIVSATHRSSRVRGIAVPILVVRDALPVDLAEKLLSDDDATVRFQALRALAKAGREFNDERAKAVLVKPKPASALGSLFGGPTATDTDGEEHFSRFRRDRLRAMSDTELKSELERQTIFKRDVQFAQDYKHFGKRSGALARAVDDEFRSIVGAELEKYRNSWGADDDTYKKILNLESWIRQGFTRQAIDLLCERGGAKEIDPIRRGLGRDYIEPSLLHIEFLKRFGEWSDVHLLIAMADRKASGASLLTASNDARLAMIAIAISSLGKGRLTELLALEMPALLRSLVIAGATERDYSKLADDQILLLLSNDNENVRRMTALRAIKTFGKGRLKRVLHHYVNERDHRYYNVIHWLDLGLSLPKTRVVAAVSRAIEKEDP